MTHDMLCEYLVSWCDKTIGHWPPSVFVIYQLIVMWSVHSYWKDVILMNQHKFVEIQCKTLH